MDEYKEIDWKIDNIDDLIKLSELYDESKPELMKKYTIDLKKLVDMKEALTELNNMIGMQTVKNSIIRQVIYFLQGIEEQQDMLHMVITGAPGTGKTSLGVILSKLYYSMGLLDNKPSINPLTGKKEKFMFKIYKRADLVGQYLGHTAIKTQKAIDNCLGGVMFIDEAYSLGHDEKSDIYTKECVDTINQNLSENKKNFILIIAGYAEQLDKCFFSHNEGLKRRFAFRYNIEKYTTEELAKMLELKIKLSNWKLDESIHTGDIIDLIDGSENMFKNFGGDIESWILQIKIEHGVRIFGKHPRYRRILILDDLRSGLKQFKIAKEDKLEKERLEFNKHIAATMYM
jgi:SpoVK/Ycf46/Vps4 family AAA+-type ATPase